MTIRWLGMSPPPDEDWVDRRLHRLGRPGPGVPLRLAGPRPRPRARTASTPPTPGTRPPASLGIDARFEAVRRAKKRLFNPDAVALEVRLAGPSPQGRASERTAGRGRRVDHARRVLVPARRRTGRPVRLHPDLDVLGRRRRAVPRRVRPHRRPAPAEGPDPRRAGQRRRPHHRGREPAAAADATHRRAQPPVVPQHAADARPVPALRLRLAVGAVDRAAPSRPASRTRRRCPSTIPPRPTSGASTTRARSCS